MNLRRVTPSRTRRTDPAHGLQRPSAADGSRPNIILVLLDDTPTFFYEAWDSKHTFVGEGVNPRNTSTDPRGLDIYVQAPVLQELIGDGVAFLNAYAQPVCGADRASVFSGLWAHQHGIGRQVQGVREFNTFSHNSRQFNTAVPIAQLLRERGYTTGIAGKWHLANHTRRELPSLTEPGTGWAHIPQEGKWDDYRCTFSNLASTNSAKPSGVAGSNYSFFVARNGFSPPDTVQSFSPAVGAQQAGFYAGDIVFDDAAEFIAGAPEPWLSVVTPNPMHNPFQYPMPQGKIRTPLYRRGPNDLENQLIWTNCAAALEFIDTRLGELLEGLPAGQRERTVVIFCSDNGGPTQVLASMRDEGGGTRFAPQPYSLGPTMEALIPRMAFKGSVLEGGTRVPLVISGPPVAGPMRGRSVQALAHSVDLYATIAALAGADPGIIAGVSLLPILQGERASVRNGLLCHTFAIDEDGSGVGRPGDHTLVAERGETVSPSNFDVMGYTRVITNQGAQAGRYKLVRTYDPLGNRVELYQLEDRASQPVDLYEQNDLAANPAYAEVLQIMNDGLDAMLAE